MALTARKPHGGARIEVVEDARPRRSRFRHRNPILKVLATIEELAGYDGHPGVERGVLNGILWSRCKYGSNLVDEAVEKLLGEKKVQVRRYAAADTRYHGRGRYERVRITDFGSAELNKPEPADVELAVASHFAEVKHGDSDPEEN